MFSHLYCPTEYHLKVILPSYPPVALSTVPSTQHPHWKGACLSGIWTANLYGRQIPLSTHPSPPIFRYATRFVRSRWLFVILGSVERKLTGDEDMSLPNDTVSWFPFVFDTGLIRFEGEGTITFSDLQDFSG